MPDAMERTAVEGRHGRRLRSSREMIWCEALEGRTLLSRGGFLGDLGGMGFGRHGRSPGAEIGSFGGGGSGAMFGSGAMGLGGGMKNPIFLLTASLLDSTSGSTTPVSRSVLSSASVQSAYQTLQADFNNDVAVGSKPTHATVGQLEDDLTAIRKGNLSGTAATTAIQNDEAAVLTSMGLSTSQVAQIQSDVQAVQSAIQSASSTTTTSGISTTTTDTSSTTTTGNTTTSSMGAPGISTPPGDSAVQSAMQTLQSDLQADTPSNAQPTYASIGEVQDDLTAIGNGTSSGSQAVTTIQNDTAAVFSSEGMTQAQISQIQSDQSALGSAIQAANGTTSSSTNSSASPTSLAAVQATMQSVQPYLVGVPGVGGPLTFGFGGRGMGGPGESMPQGFGGGMGGSGGALGW